MDGQTLSTIDNQLLRDDRSEGLFLHHDKLLEYTQGEERKPVKTLSTSKTYNMSISPDTAMKKSGCKPQKRKALLIIIWLPTDVISKRNLK